ncbi:PREDICTED: transmembrane protein 53 [Fragaria vesca subsp. vesca]|uniref:transmembrane protein 53 n=1 Tax=Fragaria vesca subsp. vesca TaxID=101020 RepID=UPI0002C34304|nr:PREDICTED: transmembrane protein 53 [Fragaria vesca subsp. vesca]XP_011463431.1 PREDICTED: transmembrane protein 53 [Fragaria vesca subsp. vesca]
MGSLSGILQRPLIAAAAVGFASFSSDFSPVLPSSKSSDSHLPTSTTLSDISVSKLSNLSFVSRIRVPLPNINIPIPNSDCNSLYSTVASSPALLKLYHSADLGKAPNPTAYKPVSLSPSVPDVSYRWHLPEPNALDVSGNSDCSSTKMRTVVVLLGWLGAKQKHLKRYADWYTSQGYHAITFTLPMADILKYQPGGKVEDHIDSLVTHLADWLEEEQGKNLMFHTFSNTGWLTYGVMLEKFQKHDPSVMGRIRGCVVDSAPVAAPDPQVWASGFSAAFLKKHSVATKGTTDASESVMDVLVDSKGVVAPKPAVTEAALLLVLEKFFKVVLNIPTVNRRLSDVLGLLSARQPSCPQLYIYSSADRVIPAGSVESFIKQQRRAGHEVRACNFVSTPHVDHFRNDPKLYTSELTHFLEDCVLTGCKQSH